MVVLGFNTPSVNSQRSGEGLADRLFHHRLSVQAGAYQNGTFVVGVAKAGIEEGVDQIGGSCIIAPSGEIIAAC
ncbi:nitrilase-related carbon-nitrogen hydrolase, partial [Klebsiella pneumoniae]|uniref:nitrilase-related carbon-nitrogen hydrolase n=1 Tax=Klebsiella pneumoniae TaxID=573 RepID=UPI0027D2F08A